MESSEVKRYSYFRSYIHFDLEDIRGSWMLDFVPKFFERRHAGQCALNREPPVTKSLQEIKDYGKYIILS